LSALNLILRPTVLFTSINCSFYSSVSQPGAGSPTGSSSDLQSSLNHWFFIKAKIEYVLTFTFFHKVQDAHSWPLTDINVTFNIDKQFRTFAWQTLPSKDFHYLHSCRRQNYLRPSTLYFSFAWGHNIFFGCCNFHELYRVSLTAEIYSKPQCRLQKWKSKLSWSYILTFPGPLLAMCCVWRWEWPTNLLTILSFRFQAKKNIVIIESLVSFPPMW